MVPPTMGREPTTGRPPSARRAIFNLAWRTPLFAIPFALFFGTLFSNAGWQGYLRAYVMALAFGYCIALLTNLNAYLLLPKVLAPRAGGKVALPVEIASYIGMSILGAFIAAAIVHFTVMPGFLGGPRAFLITGMFSILFSVLITGLIYGWVFYRQSLQRARAEQELEMARRIQRSFLITQFPSSARVEVHAYNRSSREVSGDFYDVVPGVDGDFLIALADVAGKGVPAALLTSMLQASLRTQAPTVRSTADIMLAINRLTHQLTASHQFATFFLGRLDERTLELAYTNAGHNPPMLVRANGTIEELETGGTVVGILDLATFEEGRVTLAPGDRLLVFSDGLTEGESPTRELYGEERLRTFLRGLPRDLGAAAMIERVTGDLDRHLAGHEAGDDVTLLVLRVLPGA
jgi:serine phosphatase RsbU (regulator of sigma subunit)